MLPYVIVPINSLVASVNYIRANVGMTIIHSSRRFDVWVLQPKNIPGDFLLLANKQKTTSTNPQDLKRLHDIIVYKYIYTM